MFAERLTAEMSCEAPEVNDMEERAEKINCFIRSAISNILKAYKKSKFEANKPMSIFLNQHRQPTPILQLNEHHKRKLTLFKPFQAKASLCLNRCPLVIARVSTLQLNQHLQISIIIYNHCNQPKFPLCHQCQTKAAP